MTLYTRDFVSDIEIRSDGSGRTVHGLIVPYGQEAVVSDGGPAYREVFLPGAFARDIEARNGNFGGVKFLYQHNRDEPIGRAIELRDDASGLYGAFRVANTARGNEVLELLRDGVLDSFSVGFRPVDPEPGALIPRNGLLERVKAALRESSVVTFPAYAGALIAGVRAAEDLLTTLEHEGPADSTADERSDQPTETPDPAPASATPLGLAPAQRRARLHPNLTKEQ